MDTDVIVAGEGVIIGVWSTSCLAKSGTSVALIERGKPVRAVLTRMHPDQVESHNAASRFRCPFRVLKQETAGYLRSPAG